MSETLIFNPEGVRIGEYRNKYPELKAIKEFQPLSDFELVFIWYYINPTSFYVYQFPKKLDRINAVCEKLYTTEETAKDFKDKFMSRVLINQEEWDLAIDRMAKMIPDARREAKEMVDQIFKDYKMLLDLPLDKFMRGESIDFNNYLSVRKTITKDLEEIIEKVECGFGVNRTGEITSDGQNILETYHKNKMNLSEQK